MADNTRQVILNRTFNAGIDRLWDAFTTKEDMLMWYSPSGMTTPHVEIDLRVGGSYAITMQYDATGEKVTVRGVFKIIEKPKKLVYSWKWDGSDEETEVAVMFRTLSDGETELTLVHSGFAQVPTESDVKNNWTVESHTAGWTTAFEKLERAIIS